jgi:putative peptide zinc metalloprotease protein
MALVPHGGATAAQPALLLVKQGDGYRTIVTGPTGGAGRALPFALPGKVQPGETRALATNTKDGSTVYDVAYALVTVTDGSAVTNVNDAWALASCNECTTVAVSFQVVLVVGRSATVTPINAAVAANKDCYRCVTAALAVQLVVSISQVPTAEVQAQLNAALAKLDDIKGLDPGQLVTAVTTVQTEVLSILTDAGLVDGVTTKTATAAASTTPSPLSVPTQAGPAASPSASASPASSPTPTPTASPTTEPSSPAPSAPSPASS